MFLFESVPLFSFEVPCGLKYLSAHDNVESLLSSNNINSFESYSSVLNKVYSCQWDEAVTETKKMEDPAFSELVYWLYSSYLSYLSKNNESYSVSEFDQKLIEELTVNVSQYKSFPLANNASIRKIFMNCPKIVSINSKKNETIKSASNDNLSYSYIGGYDYMRDKLAKNDVTVGDLAKIKKYALMNKELSYSYLLWCKERGLYKDGVAIFKKLPIDWSSGVNFSNLRKIYVRNILYNNITELYEDAYFLTSANPFESGGDMVEMEWLAGWVALEYLDNPSLARRHFTVIVEKSNRAISKSRGLYWLARSYDALGDKLTSYEKYKKAANYPNTFYGQLALQKLGNVHSLSFKDNYELIKKVDISKGNIGKVNYVRGVLYKNIYILSALKENGLLKILMDRIALHTGDMAAYDYDSIFKIASMTDNKYLGLIVAKDLYLNKNIIHISHLYPYEGEMFNFSRRDHKYYSYFVSLVYALSRQESSFDHMAISPAGARGLMQLMPMTAGEVIRNKSGAKLTHDQVNLFDPNCNVWCGTNHLIDLGNYYSGRIVPVIAAYNAGRHRVDKWINDNKELFESGDIDKMINWIELIPFSETRNYVMRVLENVAVYHSLLYSNDDVQPVILPTIITNKLELRYHDAKDFSCYNTTKDNTVVN
ncbi:lytic transglycosylase domain-containing protein [Anaplasmataceae bacterium AB001_6]|nr:lytic transglycosylase domain-containing protein [Anaplasmataceae bacterium AB001_6]